MLTGGPRTAYGRRCKRQAMQQAEVTEIDHLIATHYHQDHYGGIPDLSRLVTIKHFYDHGKMTAMAEDEKFAERYAAYQSAAKGQTTALKPGDTIPLKATTGTPPVKLLCVASNAGVISGKGKSRQPCVRIGQTAGGHEREWAKRCAAVKLGRIRISQP